MFGLKNIHNVKYLKNKIKDYKDELYKLERTKYSLEEQLNILEKYKKYTLKTTIKLSPYDNSRLNNDIINDLYKDINTKINNILNETRDVDNRVMEINKSIEMINDRCIDLGKPLDSKSKEERCNARINELYIKKSSPKGISVVGSDSYKVHINIQEIVSEDTEIDIDDYKDLDEFIKMCYEEGRKEL